MNAQMEIPNTIAPVAANKEGYCVGCSSCRYSCPTGAISMVFNEEGFKIPLIDEVKCVHCGKCRTACPVCNPVYDKAQKPRCFAAQASDELRTGKSASGAIFPVLAEKILENGGVVCGAAWNENWQCEHIIVDTAEGLERIKNSKYVQSDLESCLPELKRLLNAGCPVLFTGTPCQVAALYTFLGEDYENLYTADIICHGVPSPMVWKRYLEENFDVNSIRHIAFRDKRKGWGVNSFIIEHGNNEIHCETYSNGIYFNGFAKNIILRKSCGSCKFNRIPRQADLTIGDFWGIQKVDKGYDDGKGTSVVLENTIKGCLLFDSITSQLKKVDEFSFDLCTPANPNILGSSVEHPQRDAFFEKITHESVTSALQYFTHDVSDCKIINYWFAVNYGAILTCYALQECIKKMGYTVKVINYMTEDWRKKYHGSFSEKFAKTYINLTNEIHKKEELTKFNKGTETFITGSDQVFRYGIYNTHGGNAYQLDFVAPNRRSIACSASFGFETYQAPALDGQLFWHLLEQLDALSVREAAGATLCRQHSLEASVIIDPVFYLERSHWLNLAGKCEEEIPRDGVLYFSLPYMQNKEPELLSIIAEKLGVEVTVQPFDRERSVEAWLASIQNARFVITDSFHATCFALILHKPFLVLSTYATSRSRMDQILGKVGLSARIVDAGRLPQNLDDLLIAPDWLHVDEVLADERKKAVDWLNQALKAPIKQKSSATPLLESLITEVQSSRNEITNLKKHSAPAALSSADIMRHVEWLKSESRKTEEYLAHMLTLIAHENTIKLKYYRYKWISKISWGKLRKKYLCKRWKHKALLQEIRQFKKTH